MRILSVCLLSLALLPSCASRNNYVINRGADLADILRIHVMFGPGIAAKVEATRLLHLGAEYTHKTFAWGFHNREVGAWRETIWSWGLVVGAHNEQIERIDRVSGSYGWAFGGEGGAFHAAEGAGGLDLLTFRGTLMLVVGLDLEVRVGEVLDFLAGLAQFDPSGDDRNYETMKAPDEPAPEAPPATAG